LKSQAVLRGRANTSFCDLGAGVLLRVTSVVAFLCAGSLLASQALVHSHSALMRLGVPLAGRMGLSGVSALLGCAGVFACRVLEGRSYIRRWALYLYALAFLGSSFVLLMQWFEVSGASGFWS
jgi:hypothetical protein